jgi:U4/U6 small nuclear ribonucleoprotein PRP3
MVSKEDVNKLKVVDLREKLKERGLSTKGKKADLQERLLKFLDKEAEKKGANRKRRRPEKDDNSPPSKRTKKESVKYLSDEEENEKMEVEKQSKEETMKAKEEPVSSKTKSEPPKKKKPPEKEKPKKERTLKATKKTTKSEPVALKQELDFSGAEEEFSGAEEESEEYDDEKWRAQWRSGLESPPPPEELKRNQRAPRSRWGSSATSAKPILPQLPTQEQLANLSITAMQDRITAELNALSRTSVDPSTFMKSVGNNFKEVEEPVLERGSEIDPQLYDPRVGSGADSKRSRKKGKALRFFKKGSLVQKANRIAQLLERQYIHATPSAVAAAELEDDKNYLSEDEIPEIEWWDKPYTGDLGYKASENDLKLTLITDYVHNPAPLRDLSTDNVSSQLPLYLTRKEKDKIRRKKSKDKHDAMIDEIRLGIREPPEPKLKVSNIVRVLGSKFIQDPSAAEAKARTQEALRLMKHQLHNENRKLTKSQRSEKKRKKLLEDTSRVVHTAVFRVMNLSDSKIRWKIKTNAKQYNLTGCMMLFSRMNMVMVEGGPKAISKYSALMTRRIQWSHSDAGTPCVQVWQGVTGAHVFRDFVIETFEEEADVIKYLDQKKVLGYWKQCKNFQQHITF